MLGNVPDLQRLSIGGAPLSQDDLLAISTLDKLPELYVSRADVDDDDLQHLSRLKGLRELRLRRNPITDVGLKHLESLTNLQTLDLSFTQVRGPGLVHITPSLRELLLTTSLLDDESVDNCTRFRRLARLDFQNTKVTEAGLMKLASLHWLTTISPPREISRDDKRRFREAYFESRAAAASAGEPLPPDGRGLAPYE